MNPINSARNTTAPVTPSAIPNVGAEEAGSVVEGKLEAVGGTEAMKDTDDDGINAVVGWVTEVSAVMVRVVLERLVEVAEMEVDVDRATVAVPVTEVTADGAEINTATLLLRMVDVSLVDLVSLISVFSTHLNGVDAVAYSKVETSQSEAELHCLLQLVGSVPELDGF